MGGLTNVEPVHILVVEDNPGDVRLFEEVLSLSGIASVITHCETVESAIRTVNAYSAESENLPSILLLDFNLPAGESLEVLAAAIENPALKKMRKAVITSSVAPKDREAAFRSGADSFIFKPADFDAFLTQVGSAIVALLEPGLQSAVQFPVG